MELLQADLVGNSARDADLFLRFVSETSALAHDEERLLQKVSDFTFKAFPQATHVVVVTAEPNADMEPLLVRGRNGEVPEVAISRTLVRKVMSDGVSMLYSHNLDALLASESLQLSRIETALCAPLWSRSEAFGVIQIDVRHPGKGTFSRKDVDRLALFGHYLALVLDNLRLYRDQREAFESTIQALMHSLLLKDPETAGHSERVQAVAVHLGRAIGLSGPGLDALRVAAVLHDMGKQGVRDEVLFKPARLTDSEMKEMNGHAHLTQDILDRVRYPAHLKHVPTIAAYHHEKMDGSGPYKIPAEQIPLESRIISVADCFDALISARAYKSPMPAPQVMNILEQGKGREWDANVVEVLRQELGAVLSLVYGQEPMEEAA
jgi:HD-GYP domain-containing protein (c-di-GMP phosphodiesterase class II)